MSPARFTHLPAVALVALLLLVVACRTDDNAPAASPTATDPAGASDGSLVDLRRDDSGGELDACSLLDAGEVERFAGEPMDEPHLQRMGPPLYQEICTYGSTLPGSYSLLQVSVIDESRFDSGFTASGFSARTVWEQTRSIYPRGQVLPGVGDSAFRHGDTVEVLAGEFAVGVSVARNDGTSRTPVATDTLVHLARVVVSRLGALGE